MQWKKSYYIATKVSSRKGATTFGDLPDCSFLSKLYYILQAMYTTCNGVHWHSLAVNQYEILNMEVLRKVWYIAENKDQEYDQYKCNFVSIAYIQMNMNFFISWGTEYCPIEIWHLLNIRNQIHFLTDKHGFCET